ncbi:MULTISPECIES: metallophosphoesterase [unclassified Paraflavitalea]|uniref:metallophosphoesterase n=1 Tax=unclassified Paraflavitalea TaxID=2798305 RepID=UPI003D33669C
MRNSGFLWIVLAIMVVLDVYVFQGIKWVSASASNRWRTVIFWSYWTLSIGAVLSLLLMPYMDFLPFRKNNVYAIIIGLFIAKLIIAIFLSVDDIRRIIIWLTEKVRPATARAVGEPISRSTFISWLGIAVGGGIFGSLLYGFNNKYNYQVKKVSLKYPNLPAPFKGLKLVHISDVHSGSFTDKKAVSKGIEKILSEKPDLILFTGDLVNDKATEMEHYQDLFSQLQAPMGVYSTLGNHDYGDYVQWPSPDAKKANLERLKQVHADMGWRLLMNEHVVFEKDGHSIALLGIENWGAKGRFPKYGKMKEAYEGAGHHPFKILMSHDPSHWDAEVRKEYKDIDLMLAGHTHGMQFGVELPGFRWSPVQYMYEQWAGLYEQENQKLYVNRGFGFIGYPGRVGILPEITVIELT